MKKIKMCAFAALMVAGFMLPQEAFAYKYYIHSESGKTYVIEAKDEHEASRLFKDFVQSGMFGAGGFTLTSRPKGGYLETSSCSVERATEILMPSSDY